MGASNPLARCELLRETLVARRMNTTWIHTGHKDVNVSRMTKMSQNYISFYILQIENKLKLQRAFEAER